MHISCFFYTYCDSVHSFTRESFFLCQDRLWFFLWSFYIWLNENSLLIFIFFLYCFYTSVKGKCFNSGVNSVISWCYWNIFGSSIENESVIDPKYLLKVEATSFCFDNNLSFSSNIILSCILLFLFEKYG